jgi:hypothetical protein
MSPGLDIVPGRDGWPYVLEEILCDEPLVCMDIRSGREEEAIVFIVLDELMGDA